MTAPPKPIPAPLRAVVEREPQVVRDMQDTVALYASRDFKGATRVYHLSLDGLRTITDFIGEIAAEVARLREVEAQNRRALKVITREYCDERGEPRTALPPIIDEISDALLGMHDD